MAKVRIRKRISFPRPPREQQPNPKGVAGFKPGNKLGQGSRAQLRPDYLTQGLISQLHEIDRNDPARRPHYEIIIDKLIEMAGAGDLFAMQMIFDWVQGRPKQRVEPGVIDAAPTKMERIKNIIIDPHGKPSSLTEASRFKGAKGGRSSGDAWAALKPSGKGALFPVQIRLRLPRRTLRTGERLYSDQNVLR